MGDCPRLREKRYVYLSEKEKLSKQLAEANEKLRKKDEDCAQLRKQLDAANKKLLKKGEDCEECPQLRKELEKLRKQCATPDSCEECPQLRKERDDYLSE